MEDSAARVTMSRPAVLRLPDHGIPAARQSFLREHNLSLVLRHIVDAPKPVSRAELAKATGLARATVSALVDLLIAGDMLVELDPEVADRAGRPAVPLVPSSQGIVGLGLGIEVDRVGARVLDLAGNVIDERIVPGNFRASDPSSVLGRVVEIADRLTTALVKRGTRLAGVGVSVPGSVQAGGSLVHYAPNLDWHDVDIARVIRAKANLGDVPILLGNDADLGARAEARARNRVPPTRRQDQQFLYVTCEIGVGGAIVVRGEIGEAWSGEIGHVVVDRAGPPCGCGARGCLEQYAGRDSMLGHAGLGLSSSMTDLRRAVEAGDSAAGQAVSEAAEGLGLAIASALNLVDLDTVVLGGAYVELAELLIPTIQRHIRRRTLASRWRPVSIDVACAGAMAPLSGAGMLVIDEVVANPAVWLATG